MPRRLVLLFLLCMSGALWAAPAPSADDVAAARQRYAQWRRRPEQLARLRQDWQSFLALPPQRREQMLNLDHELAEEPLSEQARVWSALERYTDWLEHLPEKDRHSIREAANPAARLALIRGLREREWMKRQARALREQWAKLDGEARSQFVLKLRREARQRHRDWQIAGRFWKELESHQPLPAQLKALPNDVQEYVHEILLPMLAPGEKERLSKAEGSWPAFPLTLVELADKHPPALPGPHGPRTIDELPKALRGKAKLKSGLVQKSLRAAEGRWPAFAIALTELAEKKGWAAFPHELWPHSFHGLLKPMQTFVQETLTPALTNDEKLKLASCPRQWPDYPLLIQQLSRVHHLQPPWHTLPGGTRERWDPERYRLTDRPSL
jgi:hypothetical protein